MSEKHSQAAKARWASLSQDERKKRMKLYCGAKRWTCVSEKDRKKHAAKMTRARLAKKNNK